MDKRVGKKEGKKKKEKIWRKSVRSEVHVRGFRERSRVRTSGCDGAC